MSTATVVLEAPPEPKPGAKFARVDRARIAEAAELGRSHPGEWMRIATFPAAVAPGRQAAYFARDVNGGRVSDLKGAEAVSRTIDGEGVVWVRFPATEAPEPSAAAPTPDTVVFPAASLLDAVAEAAYDQLVERLKELAR